MALLVYIIIHFRIQYFKANQNTFSNRRFWLEVQKKKKRDHIPSDEITTFTAAQNYNN